MSLPISLDLCVSRNGCNMRLTEAKVKAAIQHSEQEVRLTALRRFAFG